jgi:hypothetical protein
MATNSLTRSAYLVGVIAAAASLLLYVAPQGIGNPITAAGLLATTVVLSVFKLRLPLGTKGVSTMSMAYTVDFIALIVNEINLAMVLAAVGVLVQCTLRVHRKQPVHRTAFSAAAVIIAVQISGWGWRTLGGSLTDLTIGTTALPLMVTAIVYFVVNTSLIAGAIAVTGSARAWSPEFLKTAPAYVVSAIVAALVALAVLHGVIFLLPVVASPLFVCYRAYRARWAAMTAELVNPAPQPAVMA